MRKRSPLGGSLLLIPDLEISRSVQQCFLSLGILLEMLRHPNELLRDALRIPHHDNASPHTTKQTIAFLHWKNIRLLPHCTVLYSPDLTGPHRTQNQTKNFFLEWSLYFFLTKSESKQLTIRPRNSGGADAVDPLSVTQCLSDLVVCQSVCVYVWLPAWPLMPCSVFIQLSVCLTLSCCVWLSDSLLCLSVTTSQAMPAPYAGSPIGDSLSFQFIFWNYLPFEWHPTAPINKLRNPYVSRKIKLLALCSSITGF